jgi:YVTN family beta-propeller protein
VAGAKLARTFAAIVGREVSAAGGELRELRGDEALAVFSSPRLALRCAMRLQATFAAETQQEPDFPMRVGIGLDVGEAVNVEGGYRGGALNLAARLCALAGPGEVLASEAVAHLARKVEGLQYLERRARLKGLAEPVRFVRVVSEGAPDKVRPPWLRAPSRRLALARITRAQGRYAVLVAVAAVGAAVIVAVILTGGGGGLASIAADSVGSIDAHDGRLLASAPVDGRPGGIAYYRGAVWVADATTNAVSRIDPKTNAVEDTIGVGTSPSDVAAGDGAIWVTNSESSTVSEVNPDAKKVVQTIGVGTGPRGIAVGDAGVFVANSLDGTISRIDPTTGTVTKRYPVGGTPTAVAVGGGAIWVASETTGTVTRIDPTSGSVLASIHVGNGPVAVAFGAGAAWVANAVDGTVSRIDASTNAVAATMSVGRDPEAIAVGDGGVWVANRDATVVQLDPRTGHVRQTLHTGSSPQAITIGGARVWVSAAASPSAHRGGTLRVAIADDNGTLDPAVAYASDAWVLITNVYDGLVAFRRVGGAAGGTIVADLATAVPTPTDGGRTYTFELRRGIRYSTGALVKASDFRHAIERVVKLSAAGPYYSNIVGVTGCRQHPAHCKLAKGIEADDKAGIVSFHLVAPDADFLYKLALTFASAVPATAPNRNLVTRPPAGTGPYEVASYQRGRSVRLIRNPRFNGWADAAQPDGYPDAIAANETRDPTRQISTVLKGEADLALPSPLKPPRQLHALTTRYAAQLHLDPLGAVFYLFLNTRRPPFSDVAARRAVAYAIDRGRVSELAGGSTLAPTTCQMLPPQFPGYRPYCPYTLRTAAAGVWTAPDPAKAQQLVARARTRGGTVTIGVTTDLVSLARPPMATLAQLGYRPVLRTLSPAKPAPPGIDAVLNAWFKDYTAASDFIDPLFTCRGGVNISKFCDSTIDSLVRRADRSQASDPATANALWATIDRKLVDRVAAVPLYAPQAIALLSKRSGNYQFNPQWGPLVDQIWVR